MGVWMAEGSNKAAETLKRALIAIERTKGRVRQLEEERKEPIAVISMACRLPGNVTTPEDSNRGCA